MKLGLDRYGRQKDSVRVQRESYKLESETYHVNELIKPASPKTETKFEMNHELVEPGNQKYHSRKLQEQQKIQFQKLAKNMQSPQNRWKKDSKVASFKSEQARGKIKSANTIPEAKNIANYIFQVGQEYRKDLVEHQQRRAKISLQAAVAKKQIDFVEREKDVLVAQNKKLKCELNLLQKQNLALRQNEQRIKRKNQVELNEKNSQIQRNKALISELQDDINSLKNKTASLVELQNEIDIIKAEKRKVDQQIQRIASIHRQTIEKNKAIQYNYKSLFQNYAKLQVSCQTLQRELHITKEYLCKTQRLHCQTKEESFKIHQQKTKQLDKKSYIIASLKTQISLLYQKVQMMNNDRQKRQKTIDQYKATIKQLASSQKTYFLQNSKFEAQIASMSKMINTLQRDIQSTRKQNIQLKETCQIQLKQLKEREVQCQNLQQEFEKSSSQWTLILKRQLSRISDQKLQYITNLEHQLLAKGEAIKQLKQDISKKETENSNFKQLFYRKQRQISDYISKVKQETEKHNYKKQQLDKLMQRQRQLLNDISKLQQKNSKYLEELHSARSENTANLRAKELQVNLLKENIIHKQILIANAEMEYVKQKALISVKEHMISQKIDQIKTQGQHFENVFKSQSSKNQQLALQLAFKQAENVRNRSMMHDIQMKIQDFEQQIQKLTNQSHQKQEIDQPKSTLLTKSQKGSSTQMNFVQKIEAILNKSKVRLIQLKANRDQLQRLSASLQQHLHTIQKDMAELTEKVPIQKDIRHNLSLQNEESTSKFLNIQSQRQQQSQVYQNKPSQLKTLKEQARQLEANRLQSFQQTLKQKQNTFKKQFQQIQNQNQQLKRQVKLLKLYRIKSEELENQVYNLSILFRNESIKSNAQRQKNFQLQDIVKVQQSTFQQIKQQLIADCNIKVKNLTHTYEQEKEELSKQTQTQKQQNQRLRSELTSINSQLLANNTKITALIRQLLQLKTLSDNKQYNLGSITLVAQNLQSMNFSNQQKLLKNTEDYVSKKGFFNYCLSLINNDTLEMKRMLNILKQERQLFVKKYIQVSNRIAKGQNALQLGRQIKVMEEHFTQLSLLHTELNNALTRVQNKLAQICLAQKSFQMCDILAKTV